jgi:signal transduction histidine kinase
MARLWAPQAHDATARSKKLLDAVPLACVVLDRGGVVLQANLAAESFLGDSPLGRALTSFAAPPDGRRIDELLTRGDGRIDVALSPSDGSIFTARVTCSTFESEERLLIALERADLHVDAARLARSLRDAEELLDREREHRERLERSNRAKDELIRALSRDVRGPINALLGWGQFLREHVLPKGSRTMAVERIERSAAMLLSMVDELLDLSRAEAGTLTLHLEPVDLGVVARSVATAATTLEVSDNPPTVFADHERMLQIASILVARAVSSVPLGGKVDVRVHSDSSHAILEVEDDGAEIDPAELPAIFDCTAEQKGLYLVRRLVELHGGSIDATSKDGNGSRLTVRLPLAAQPPPSRTELTSRQKQLRVLIVDDDQDARDLLAAILEADGASTFAARDAIDAFAMFETYMPDVILSDISFPGEDGYALIRRIRSCDSYVCAIAVSGFAAESDRQAARDAGFDAHVSKPVDPATLVRLVRDLTMRNF